MRRYSSRRDPFPGLIGANGSYGVQTERFTPLQFARLLISPVPGAGESFSMFERLFGNKHQARIRALLVGDRLDLRTLKTTEQLAAQPWIKTRQPGPG